MDRENIEFTQQEIKLLLATIDQIRYDEYADLLEDADKEMAVIEQKLLRHLEE